MALYFCRLLLIVGLCCLVGETRCSTARADTRIVEQSAENQTAKDMLNRSNLTPQEKAFVGSALDKSLRIAQDENRGRQKAETSAKVEKAVAGVWQKIAAGVAIAAAVAGGVLYFFRRRKSAG
ncbi:MAG TPA: hypothetical protein PKY99_00035 [Turneriella sp.]|nr:hypothetical protein [Turneriella sp.]